MNYEQFKHASTENMKKIANEGELLQFLSEKTVEAAAAVGLPKAISSLKKTLAK
jgi:hypothetical protein